MNHFELFGLPQQFDVETAALSEQFRELQRRFHPDKFAASSERDRLLAVQKAAEINDAFQTLKAPILRAEYILSLQGVDIRAEQQTMSDPMFLMEQMELREEAEEITHQADPESALFDFDSKVQKMYQNQTQELKNLLDEANWEQAADAVRKLKFIDKLKREIEQIEDKLLG
ncbi:MAG: co-chaperone HscB [Vibrio sp.]